MLAEEPEGLARSVALSEPAARAQARTLGLVWIEEVQGPHDTPPSGAARALLAERGMVASAEQERGIAGLDALAEPTRAALTRVLDAFIAFEASGGGPSLDALFPARNALLEAMWSCATRCLQRMWPRAHPSSRSFGL